MKIDFYTKYYNKFSNIIKLNQRDYNKLELAAKEISNLKKQKKKIIIFGKGGSSAIASHVAEDLTKNTRIKTILLTDSSLITCFSNDFGHDNWMKKAVEHYYEKGDMVIIISSSGTSKNIINAAKFCFKNKIKMISFSGMKKNNRLNSINKKGMSFWINSVAYNHIELAHLYLLLLVIDRIIFLRSKKKIK